MNGLNSVTSALDNDDLQILRRHDQRARAADVHSLQQGDDVVLQRAPSRFIERGEGLERRTVVVAEHHVGRAIALMHARPAEPWTIDELGKQVGLSRSALHERFIELVGQPPMQYLTSWRMQRGAQLLREGKATVATIAQEVGYDSEAAFARAFKRSVGLPPAAWRRGQREPLPNAVY